MLHDHRFIPSRPLFFNATCSPTATGSTMTFRTHERDRYPFRRRRGTRRYASRRREGGGCFYPPISQSDSIRRTHGGKRTYPAETADEGAEAPPVTPLPTLQANIRQTGFEKLSGNEVRTLMYRHQQRIQRLTYRRRQRIHQQTRDLRSAAASGKLEAGEDLQFQRQRRFLRRRYQP